MTVLIHDMSIDSDEEVPEVRRIKQRLGRKLLTFGRFKVKQEMRERKVSPLGKGKKKEEGKCQVAGGSSSESDVESEKELERGGENGGDCRSTKAGEGGEGKGDSAESDRKMHLVKREKSMKIHTGREVQTKDSITTMSLEMKRGRWNGKMNKYSLERSMS